MEKIKGFKGFDKNLCCTPKYHSFQYEIGGKYHEEVAEKCKSGFHFCKHPMDALRYYSPSKSRYCKVEGSGVVSEGDDKMATTDIKIIEEIGLGGIIKAAAELTLDKSYSKKNVIGDNLGAYDSGANALSSAKGDYCGAVADGFSSCASISGDYSAASSFGPFSTASVAGHCAGAVAEGTESKASATGSKVAAVSRGKLSSAHVAGCSSGSLSEGDQVLASAMGEYSAATTVGNMSVAIAMGSYSHASVEGGSIVVGAGIRSKAKGKIGSWLVLTECKMNNDRMYFIQDVKIAYVDGVSIKEDTYYVLVDGQFKIEE